MMINLQHGHLQKGKQAEQENPHLWNNKVNRDKTTTARCHISLKLNAKKPELY